MTKLYVLFREGRAPGVGHAEELYVGPGTLVETLTSRAMTFPNARLAYEFGHRHHLDEWRVGARYIGMGENYVAE